MSCVKSRAGSADGGSAMQSLRAAAAVDQGFTLINPRSFEAARAKERRIAVRLRRKGYGVWQN